MESTEKQPMAPVLPGAFSLFDPSWKAFKLNFWPFVWGTLIPFAFMIVPLISVFTARGIQQRVGMESVSSAAPFNVMAVVVGALGIVLFALIFLPYMYLLKLQSAKGVKVKTWAHFKQSLHYFWRLLGLMIVRNLIIFCGFILLIVPGFIFWRRYMLAPFYLIDEDGKVFESLTKSSTESKPVSGALWGMMGVYILISLIGFIPLVGWVVSTVMAVIYCCAQATRYLQVKGAKA